MSTPVVNHVSLREYARSRKARGLGRPVSLKGIQDAIESGRMQRSVTHVPGRLGRLEPKIANTELADRELESTAALNQDSRQDAAGVAMESDPAARVLPTGPAAAPAAPAGDPEAEARAAALDRERAKYAQLRRETAEQEILRKTAEAKMRQMDLALRAGELTRASEVSRAVEELIGNLRDRLDALPTIIGRHIAFTLDLDQDEAIAACQVALQDFRREVASDWVESTRPVAA